MKFNHRIINGYYDRNSYRTAPGLIYKQPKPKTIQQITDKQGLDEAYASEAKVHVNGSTLYVAGTSNERDAWDDLKIPIQKTAFAKRYQDADAVLKENPQVTNLVGHSLGGSAVLELQKNHTEKTFKTNTYGAPVASITTPDNIDNHRYRNYGDPVSMFDRGAESNLKSTVGEHYANAWREQNPHEFWQGVLDAHSYDNFNRTQVGGDTMDSSSMDII
jgi:hypothetical protein